jgi:hypothetical protein
MKKFSNITGQKVGEEPKREARPINEEELFKSKVMSLMDDFLTIRTYGPVDRYLRAGSIKVAGKEEFLEALMSLMTEKSIKDQSKLLEGLKADISDWKSIDSKKSSLEASKRPEIDPSDRKKIASLLESYGSDEGTLEMVAKQHASKLDSNAAKSRAESARKMSESDSTNAAKLGVIARAFEERAGI